MISGISYCLEKDALVYVELPFAGEGFIKFLIQAFASFAAFIGSCHLSLKNVRGP